MANSMTVWQPYMLNPINPWKFGLKQSTIHRYSTFIENGYFHRQGRNQDLNLAKQKYEILIGHKNRGSKLYKMTVYQAKTL